MALRLCRRAFRNSAKTKNGDFMLKFIRKNFFILAFSPALIFQLSAEISSKIPENTEESQGCIESSPLEFTEIWGYVMTGRENSFSELYPVTDVGYFWEAVDTYSNIPKPPERNEHFSAYAGRVHFVTSCDSRSQTHLLLSEKNLRKKIIRQLAEASETYDGLQIDWELVPKNDDMIFYDFLKTLKKKLKGKTLTVAVPARLKTLEKDPYDYSRLSTVADRIIIMAYDQHWSTSEPGPIASPEWGKRIYDYAKNVIPQEKLIMGAPFYGRAWTDEDLGGRAWTNISAERIRKENEIKDSDIKTDKNGNKYLQLKKQRTITFYFDDTETEIFRLKSYSDAGVEKIAFWRIGQENPEIWNFLKIK